MTRRTWVYFLSEKSAALKCFKKFKLPAEKENGEVVECLRINRGNLSPVNLKNSVSEESKAYRLFDTVSKKIVISRDIVFDEQGK